MPEIENKIITMYAESQLHAGKGTDVGIIDLPIQRERTTDFPIIQGIKGAVRASGLIDKNEDVKVFGNRNYGDSAEEEQAGNIAFSEAKILLFPMRHYKNVFVWITCPLVLSRFSRMLQNGVENNIPICENGSAITNNNSLIENGQLQIEDFIIPAKQEKSLDYWIEIFKNSMPSDYLKGHLAKSFIVVDDRLFSNIVKSSTEVMPRIKIGKNGVVDKKSGSLWYEEYLPQDTVMYFVMRNAGIGNSNDSLLSETVNAIKGNYMNVGGNETIGKGLVYLSAINTAGEGEKDGK